jgi:hypothetical protein
MENMEIIDRLKKLLADIPGLKSKGSRQRDSVEFRKWRESTEKWLNAGGPSTAEQLERIKGLDFASLQMRGFGEEEYLPEDEDAEEYIKDLENAEIFIESAIENLELKLIPRERKQTTDDDAGKSKYGKMTINQPGQVFVGDSNTVNFQNLSLRDIFISLEKEIENKVSDQNEKRKLLDRLKELVNSPLINTLLSQTIGAIFKSQAGA